MHYGIGEPDVEAIAEHGNAEGSAHVRLIETGKGATCAIRSEDCGGQ